MTRYDSKLIASNEMLGPDTFQSSVLNTFKSLGTAISIFNRITFGLLCATVMTVLDVKKMLTTIHQCRFSIRWTVIPDTCFLIAWSPQGEINNTWNTFMAKRTQSEVHMFKWPTAGSHYLGCVNSCFKPKLLRTAFCKIQVSFFKKVTSQDKFCLNFAHSKVWLKPYFHLCLYIWNYNTLYQPSDISEIEQTLYDKRWQCI